MNSAEFAASVRAYVARDWGAVERETARFWAEQKARLSADELYALVEPWNAQIRELRPEWPTEAEREADLSAHERVSELLSRVRDISRR